MNEYGVPPHEVADMLGHADDRTTMRIYRQAQTPAKLAASVAHIGHSEAEILQAALNSAGTLVLTDHTVVGLEGVGVIELH